MGKIIFLFVVSVGILANAQNTDRSVSFEQSQKVTVHHDAEKSIQWKIESETKTLNNYNLQKATAMFEGRELTAWFTTETKISTGHYRLGGLPGAILYVEDSQKDFVYKSNPKKTNGRAEKAIAS
ncbi:GLPGLI family protein [Chryseobacterium soli]|uniref:GLPGLI family protein n=1 Tax=Chryseobacterium soli TaxID=445961 RepID=UPI002954AF48|nr:GLPGLI family protein [Chryseobacterium soli]MDV7698487.1 GLPGLI family protein [Chryseobacterium soli]